MRWLALVALMAAGGSAQAEISREECVQLLDDAEQDKEFLVGFINQLLARGHRVAPQNTEDPLEREVWDSTFTFGDQLYAHIDRYTAAVSDLCRDKI